MEAKEIKEPITHETFVIGVNVKDEIIFFKSYQYEKQKDEAQSDLKWCVDNCKYWYIGAASTFKIIHEQTTHEIIIKHP